MVQGLQPHGCKVATLRSGLTFEKRWREKEAMIEKSHRCGWRRSYAVYTPVGRLLDSTWRLFIRHRGRQCSKGALDFDPHMEAVPLMTDLNEGGKIGG